MSQREKLLAQARNNPGNVRFDDACKLAEWYGFTKRSGGKHNAIYKRQGFPMMLNFQRRSDGMAKTYQVRDQLLVAIDTIELESKEREEYGQ